MSRLYATFYKQQLILYIFVTAVPCFVCVPSDTMGKDDLGLRRKTLMRASEASAEALAAVQEPTDGVVVRADGLLVTEVYGREESVAAPHQVAKRDVNVLHGDFVLSYYGAKGTNAAKRTNTAKSTYSYLLAEMRRRALMRSTEVSVEAPAASASRESTDGVVGRAADGLLSTQAYGREASVAPKWGRRWLRTKRSHRRR